MPNKREAVFYGLLFEGCVAAVWCLGGISVALTLGVAAFAAVGAVAIAAAAG